jgi:predicted ATPase/class 3 adenylate cyclase
VLFCDLVGSTELSARLDPEDMGPVIGAYQHCCAEVVKRWEGHIANFMGDGVLALFGYPRAHEDDVERAVRAGLKMTVAVGRLHAGDVALAARVGIATGEVVVGELFAEGTQEQPVVGETPNLAARLQTLAEPGTVVVAASTRRLLGGLFELVDLGPARLKGYAEPVVAFRVVGEGRAQGRFEALRGHRLTPLVGREHELGMLLDRWEIAKGSEGQVMLLSGEPGIGKSRLTQALLEEIAPEPHVRLRYYCSPYHTNSALHPVIEQLQRAAAFAPDDDTDARLDKLEAVLRQSSAQVADVAPLFAALVSIPSDARYPPLNLTPPEQKAKTFEALLAQLEGLAAGPPVLMIIEDAHWIDPTSADLFGEVIERLARLPMLLVITFRPEFMSPWSGHAHVTALTLSRLGQRQCAAIIERLTGGKALPPEVIEQLLAKTDGVPLFIEELTKTLLESGLLTESGNHYKLSGPLPSFAIPATLHDSLMARLDRLGPIKEVAQTAAAIGREFSYLLLAAVSPLSEPSLNAALGQLVCSELIFRRGSPPRTRYSFKHALLQDAAHEGLLKSRRQQLHARIATILEGRFEEVAQREPELLAHHYTEADDVERAADYWQRAGQRAAQRSANVEAVAHLQKGLELLKRLPSSSARDQQELDLQIALGSPLIVTKGYTAPEVEQAYLRAQELGRRVGDVSHLFTATWGLWIHNLTRMRLKTARRLADELLSLARRGSDPAYLLQARHATWTTCLYLPELSACAEETEKGVVLYDRDQHRSHKFLYGGHDPGVCAANYRALSQWLLGFPDQAVDRAEQAVALAHELDHSFSLILALSFFSYLCHFRRDAALAREHALAVTTLCTKQGVSPHYLATAGIIQGWAEVHETRAVQGIAEIRQGLDQLEAMRVHHRRSYYLAILAEAYGSVTESEQGLCALAEAATFMEETGEAFWEAEIHRLKGELLLHRSPESQAQAEASFRNALNTARHQEARSLELRAATSLARLMVAEGRRADAHALLAPVYGWFTEGFATPDLKDAKALLDELA